MASLFYFLLYKRKEKEGMSKRSSVWFVVLVSIVAIAFVATGCAKKQIVKEEAAARPMVEAKKEEVKAAPAPPTPKEEVKAAPAPPAPKEEAKKEAAVPPAKPAPIELTALGIWFAFDDYNLSNHAKENLEKIAHWLSKTPGANIQIQGNTCNIGTAEYNLALGEQRANSAKRYLEGLGVSASRLSTISYGLEKPLMPNTNEENRSKNRRDEFVEMK
jgi:peptidoglycan-associated lipoprotein